MRASRGNCSPLEAETGERLWAYETESAVVGPPAIADGREYDRSRATRSPLSEPPDSDLFEDE
ncbi:hypothetical protein HTG_06980 [Natrinema mahii]|nr:hypothetical protein HTG_06980 [Natrinema mahii]